MPDVASQSTNDSPEDTPVDTSKAEQSTRTDSSLENGDSAAEPPHRQGKAALSQQQPAAGAELEGLVWGLLGLILSAEQHMDLALSAVRQGIQLASAQHTGLLMKIESRLLVAAGEFCLWLSTCRTHTNVSRFGNPRSGFLAPMTDAFGQPKQSASILLCIAPCSTHRELSNHALRT